MASTIKFVQLTQTQYDAKLNATPTEIVSTTLYFTSDTQRLYKGQKLYSQFVKVVTGDTVEAVKAKVTLTDTLYVDSTRGSMYIKVGDTVKEVGLSDSKIANYDSQFSSLSDSDSTIDAKFGTFSANKIATVNASADALEYTNSIVTSVGDSAVDTNIPTQKAVKTYVEGQISATSSELSASISTLDAFAKGLKIVQQQTAQTGYAATYFLADKDGNNISGSKKINIIKDQFLKDAQIYNATADSAPEGWDGDTYVKGHKFLKLVFEITRGTSDTDTDSVVYIDVNELFDSYTSGNKAITVDNDTNQISLLVKTDDKYIEIDSTNGLQTKGIDEAISSAVTASEATLKADYQSSISAASSSLQNSIDGLIDTTIPGLKADYQSSISAASSSLQNSIDKKLDTTVFQAYSSSASATFSTLTSAVTWEIL